MALGWIVALASCGQGQPEHVFEPSYFDLEKPDYFPSQTNVPDNNLLSSQGVRLGRYLFYDIRLSGRHEGDSMLSCASCHRQAHSFELEQLIRKTLLDSTEFAGNADSIVKRIASIPMYPPLFEEAFGSEIVSMDRICFAIAQFVRTLVSSDSKFDRYMRGEAQLTAEEMRGYVLFTTEEGADCFHCHGGSGNVLFSTYDILVNGLDPEEFFTDAHDRYSVTGNVVDRGAYRVPTLRNIEFTAPYMHDGRFSTLDEVIDQYSENVYYSPYISPLMHHVQDGGVQLTVEEKACLKAFLLTLSDEGFLNDPNFSNPFMQDTIPASDVSAEE